jgi:hypothetical protein
MTPLVANIAPQHATSLNLSHTMIMAREGYQRNDWCIVTLNDAVEDALSKILRFGFDIDRDTASLGPLGFDIDPDAVSPGLLASPSPSETRS